MEACGSRFVGCSSFLRGVAAFIIVCATTVVFPATATQLTCDPEFRQGVEECLKLLQGFPAMTRRLTLQIGDWNKTDVICKWLFIPTAAVCIKMKFASCPKASAYRSVCGFQGLDTELLVQYGETICNHSKVLKKKDTSCVNGSMCALESCLQNYDPILPTSLNTGIWQTPLNLPQCRYFAYAEHCYEKSLLNNCHSDFYEAYTDILNLTRPYYCTDVELARLRETFASSASGVDRSHSAIDTVLYSVIGVTLFIGRSVIL